jgi:plastocyanin
MRLLVAPAAVFVLVAAAACGGGSGATFPTTVTSSSDTTDSSPGAPGGVPATPAGPPAAGTCTQEVGSGGQTISMEGTHNLTPADVSVKVGDPVTFTNNSQTNHHIKFNNGPDCGFTLIGKSASVSFDAAGAYSYVCTIHPTFMKGTVTVQ